MKKVNPLQLLSEELESEQDSVRVNAVRRLPVVATVMGDTSQAKTQILGFIDTMLQKEENDEVLYGVAESLTTLSSYFKVKMIYILEKLVSIEESVVRQKAVCGYVALAKSVGKKELKEVVLPNVKKLSESSSLTTKISAVDVMTDIYPLCGEDEKKVIRGRFNVLFGEDSLMVRRVLATKLGTLCGYMKKSLVVAELIKSFKMLSNDDSAKVRIITIDSLVNLAECLSEDENKTHMIPIIINLTSDKSWRVRVHLASRFDDISNAVGADVSDSLVSVFASLLRDAESLVRLDALKSLSKFVGNLKNDRISGLISVFKSLSTDPVALVRVSSAELFQAMLKNESIKDMLKTKADVREKIHAIIKTLTQDEDMEVKIEAFEVVKLCGTYVPHSEVEELTVSIYKTLEENTNWRLRNSGIQTLLGLSLIYANQTLFDQKFKKAFLRGLTDKAEQVRAMTIDNIPKLSKFLNDNYLMTYVAVEMLTILAETENYNYQQRISAIYGMKELYFSLKKTDTMDQIVISQILPLTENGVVNVRMVTLKVLKSINGKTKNSGLKEQIKKTVARLAAQEKDQETLYLASKFY